MTNDKALEAARAEYRNAEENPRFVECPRCKGVGYHHGFGEDGNDPDWCSQCGGSQQIMPADEADRPLIEAISAYLSALPGEAEVVEKIEAIIEAYDADVADAWNSESGERPDLWTPEVDVPVGLLREAADALQAMQARAEKAERERDEAQTANASLSKLLDHLDPQLTASKLQSAQARVKELEEERDALRKVISECASALPNGAFISPKASVEFMAMLPAEIASVCAALSTGGSNG